MKNVDINKLANEIHVKLLKEHEQALFGDSQVTYDPIDNPLINVFVNEISSVKRHNERFTVELIKRVLEELNSE